MNKNKERKSKFKEELSLFQGPSGVVEYFSSPLILYGIQWVKIRSNMGIFDRLLQKED